MAVGKNKKLGKKGKGKKKTADLFTKKEWYEVRAPTCFPVRSIGRTCVTRTAGTKIARDSLMGRVFEVSLGDLKKDSEEEAFRKFQLKVEDVSGMNCLTNFHGMDITTDKLRSMVRKWQSLVEAQADIRTTDGFTLRLFAIGFTKKQPNQQRKTCYAQHAQIRAIRKKMTEIIIKEGSKVDLNGLVELLQSETIGAEIEKHCQAIFPLQSVKIRRVKTLKSPKVDGSKLIDAHGGVEELAKTVVDMGLKVEAVEEKVIGKAKGKAKAKAAKEEDAEPKTKDAKKDEKAPAPAKDAKKDEKAPAKDGKKDEKPAKADKNADKKKK